MLFFHGCLQCFRGFPLFLVLTWKSWSFSVFGLVSHPLPVCSLWFGVFGVLSCFSRMLRDVTWSSRCVRFALWPLSLQGWIFLLIRFNSKCLFLRKTSPDLLDLYILLYAFIAPIVFFVLFVTTALIIGVDLECCLCIHGWNAFPVWGTWEELLFAVALAPSTVPGRCSLTCSICWKKWVKTWVNEQVLQAAASFLYTQFIC